jgi:beta-lactamase regulating signal transducer with metallopeptidase domain
MNGPAYWSASPWVEAIGWTLLHSLWQGAGVAMALAVVLGVLRRAPAQARYLAACAAMMLMVALPVATLLRSGDIHPSPRLDHAAIAKPAVVAKMTPIGLDLAVRPGMARSWIVDRIEPVLPVAVALWLAGVGGFSLRLLGGWIQARRWARDHTRLLVDSWPDRLDRLKLRLGVRRAVALLESSRVEVPMVVGWVRPAILVPVAALSGLTVPELEAILAHELAHIRRHDYLVNVIQCAVEVVMFYHPATWWVSSAIRRERESCCDDLAVAACRDRVTYARALAAMEGLRVPVFSPSPAANGGILLARVRRILEPQEESMNPVRMLAGLAVVLAAAPLWFARADADRPAPTKSDEVTSPRSVDPVADVVSQVELSPTGLIMMDRGSQPAVAPRSGNFRGVRDENLRWKGSDDGMVAFAQEDLNRTGAPAGSRTRPPSAAKEIKTTIVANLDNADAPDTPPTEAEVLDKLPMSGYDHPPFHKNRRDNFRIVVEKIGDKVDPLKVYPLAGPCQLVHKHYKCTVHFDQHTWFDDPIPVHHVDHKVEVVYIDKDHLRRAPRPGQAVQDPVEDRLDRLSREIRQLKLARRRNRGEQERILDRLIGEFEELKRELRDAKAVDAAPPSGIR